MTENIVLLGIVSLMSAYQLARFARRVGNARRKYKVIPPEVSGDPNFIRYFRAQQNTLEFYPIFMVCLWVSGIFFHQVPAALVGLFYIFCRQQYFDGYTEHTEKRLGGFKRSVLALQVFIGLSTVGLLNSFLNYLGVVDLRGILQSKLGF